MEARQSAKPPVQVATPAELDRALGAALRGMMEAVGDDARPRSLEVTAQLLVEEARKLAPDCECTLIMATPARGHFTVVAAAGDWAQQFVGKELPLAGTVAERALGAGTTAEFRRQQVDGAWGTALEQGGIHTVRQVPLVTGRAQAASHRTVGLLGFFRKTPGAFTPLERDLIADYARLVTIAVDSAQMRAAIDRNAARLRIGIDTAVDRSTSLEPAAVVRRLLEHAVSGVDADRATLARVDGDTVTVEDSYDRKGGRSLVGYRQPAAQPMVRQILATRKPVVAGSYDLSTVPAEHHDRLKDIRQTVGVPLLLLGDLFGILLVGRRRDLPFGSDDVATLELLGNVAVLALRNARLFTQAQEASRAKSDCLNMAAHELRTPVSVIAGYLSMLEDGTLGAAPESWRQPLTMLSSKTHELREPVNDLLLAARLETAGVPTVIARLDLRKVSREAMARAEPRAMLLKAEIVHKLPKEPVWVEADADHLARILDNVINNALTYSAGRPWVRLVVGDGPEPWVRVEDRGREIPKEFQERIFERFFRIEDPADGYHPGTGLGLAIGRELAVRHRGTLALERSEPGKGSTFVLRLPPSRAAELA